MKKMPLSSKFNLSFPKIFTSKLFLTILLIKIIFSFCFGSNLIVDGFVPFVKYFDTSGFQNPYQHFVDLGNVKAFPYPTMMLAVLAVPSLFLMLLPNAISSSLNLELLFLRLPILIADISICYVLIRWLKTNEEKVIKYYWASPIIFYICYFHGQLDAIPTALLFLSLVLLFKEENLLSSIVAGMGIATKTNVLLALPFLAIYIWRNNSLKDAIKYVAVASVVYIALLSPFITSPGFNQMVFSASENFRMFDLNIPLNFNDITFYVAPAAFLIMFFTVASYEKINKDALLMILALVFTIVVTLVPPAPGWYYWAIPFLIYFFVKQKKVPSLIFWSMNALYLGYFLFNFNSDLFQSLQPIAPQLKNFPTPYEIFQNMGLNSVLISNILFTFLTVTLLSIAYWVYTTGIQSNLQYRTKKKPLIFGVGGDSGTGKTRTSELLENILGKQNTQIVNGDDMHKWERGDKHWAVFTHLNPEANRLHEELQQAVALADGEVITRGTYDHSTGKFTEPVEVSSNKFIVFVGLHPFYLKKMRDLQDIKIYMDPEEELKIHWKIIRDVKARGYSKQQVIEQLNKRREDKNKFIEPQKQFADIIVRYSLNKKIDKLGEENADLEKYLRIVLDNSINLETFAQAITSLKNMKFNWSPSNDLKTQTCEFSGKATVQELENILYSLVPNFEELLNNDEPKLAENEDGALQIFFIYYISEISKLKVGE